MNVDFPKVDLKQKLLEKYLLFFSCDDCTIFNGWVWEKRELL